jgi:hypothetical protein
MRHFVHLSVILLLLRLPAIAQDACRAVEYKHAQLMSNPGLAEKFQQVERFTHQQLQRPSVIVNGTSHGSNVLPLITIPVVVHIVYNNSAQNISDAQVQSQIAVLNRDYHKQNGDTAKIPFYYSGSAADCNIRFILANVDTNGNTTTGIVRRQTNQRIFAYDDAIKFTARGGDDAWDRDRYLNIWVGHLSTGVLGYSSSPGCDKQTDGVAIDLTAFGTMGTAAAPFNLGRTATHEIGHWLNLIHIWGDASCGDDEVDDTPQQEMATRGNPSGMIFSCGSTPYGNMYMNYMDFTDDAGMHLFTYGQRDRIRSLFDQGGFRNAILFSTGLAPGSIPDETATEIPVNGGSNTSISIYPNPVADVLRIVYTDGAKMGVMLVEIYNQVGQKVMTTRITGGTPIDLSSLPQGFYFLRLNGEKSGSYKLLKR